MFIPRLQYLLQQYGNNSATPSELEELAEYLKRSEDEGSFSELLMAQLGNSQTVSPEDVRAYENLAEQVLEAHRKKPYGVLPMATRTRSWWKWVAAASVLLVAASSWYLLRPTKTESATVVKNETPVPALIPPGKNGAILTLADGSTLELDTLGNGKIISQNGADLYLQNGTLAYKSGAATEESAVYNTLSTPKGRQYRLRLDDGTEVWLNAASSIRFPAVFTGNERAVEVTGEAYFEVAKDPRRPFKVKISQQAEIAVLGTHFNVNAYPNEPAITTTLLEGSVRFSVTEERNNAGNKKEKIITPGQQTKFDHASSELTATSNVETAQVIAWKNGIFDFNGAGLKTVMQQLERWYDIEVAYDKNIPDIRFFGKMTKNLTLNDLLVILEKSNVHFKIEGRKITVMP